MDCIVLAGNRESYRSVAQEDNKAFLRIGAATILEIMLDELAQVEDIDRLLLVGPSERLQDLFAARYGQDFPKPVIFYEQQADLVANILGVVAASAPDEDPDRVVLVLPSDIPMITRAEIREFIGLCDMTRYDYVGGVTTGRALAQFHPVGEKRGIRMATFRLASGVYRISNLHMVRPAAVKRGQYIRKTYALRYQKRLTNMVRMLAGLLLLLARTPTAPFFYLWAQLVRSLDAAGYKGLSGLLAWPVRLERAEKYISRILGTRFKIVVTHFGGAAVDVDNDADYLAVCQRFEEWRQLMRGMEKSPE
ncbi:Nucleotidyltransferase family protein [Sulfidibacter corallicola]|uniref:Nucleotidyltransferase family protein n=1 Tax=Sulfidibacter corallicola TaxID=2818388 RepID=A0A8A4TND6_SULCO|nr:NTP transferase domain-containing protein [Sulfidibacter corallicola]QTD51499.1 nucleotidyltransferase family protein [Sulfidibacter corallicola]